jgi:hypothetical protein
MMMGCAGQIYKNWVREIVIMLMQSLNTSLEEPEPRFGKRLKPTALPLSHVPGY